MKFIPKNDLILMLQKGLDDTELINKDLMEKIFEVYGDDYFKPDMNWFADWELCTENEKRKQFMREIKVNDE